MNLISLAISVLYFLIGLIIILGIVWLALYVVRMFVPIPPMVEKAIWVVVLILILIALLSIVSGGGGGLRSFRLSTDQSFATLAAYPTSATSDLPRLLT